MNKFTIVAKTLAGLEEILAKEVETIGGTDIVIGTRMVSYQGDKQLLYKSNLWLRTALRVLKPIEEFEASNPDDLYEQVKKIDWTQYVAEGQTIAIDNTIFSENFRNSRYAIYRAKDAICDFFVEKGMKRPKVAVASADVQLNLHISDEGSNGASLCQFSLDSSGEPLYKRGYKEQLTDAPISEVLAAGILLKAGWDGQRDLIDPMCGSGTFLVEAALIATNTPAGIYRKGYGFERWTVGELAFDADMWQDLYDDDSQEREFLHHIYGSDISKVALEITEKNVKSAGLSKYISLEVKDVEDYLSEQHPAMKNLAEGATAPMLVFNPPYGKRLFTDVPTFYRMVGSVLKKGFPGTEAWIITSDEATVSYVDPRTGQRKEGEPFDFVGLKPSIKIDMNNGGLTCQLRKYEMFAGKFNEFRAEGNELDKKSADQKEEKKFDRVERKPRAKKDGKKDDKKPFKKEGKADKKDFKKEGKSDKKFDKKFDKKGADKKASDKKGDKKSAEKKPTTRRRVFDPNRPMFAPDTDMSKMVLDYTKKEE
ncbi:MAG: THUMP domain-containing protein [Bacteroidales bacterium]|nr:THUMP domain-containing protein [Bacteroidales bacterium]